MWKGYFILIYMYISLYQLCGGDSQWGPPCSQNNELYSEWICWHQFHFWSRGHGHLNPRTDYMQRPWPSSRTKTFIQWCLFIVGQGHLIHWYHAIIKTFLTPYKNPRCDANTLIYLYYMYCISFKRKITTCMSWIC